MGSEAMMADVEFSHNMGGYEFESGLEPGSQTPENALVTMTNIAGAIVSLALIAGVGIWGYKLMVRDVSGIPVVRAAEGEWRVRPEDPGGQVALHQGLAVNAVAAEGAAAGPVDQVILAPSPLSLAEEDQPVATEFDTSTPEAPQPPAQDTLPEEVDLADPDAHDRLQQGAIDAVVAELTGAPAPVVRVAGAKTVQARGTSAVPASEDHQEIPVAEEPPVAQAVLDAPGLRLSVRPRPRPADISSLVQPASYTVPETRQEIDPSAIPSGTRLAQLGAFDSPEVARREWERLDSRFGSYLQDKSRVVQEAQSGGRTFYRLRVMGFVDLSDARRFCSALKAEGVDCIPVQVR
jgi:hypothetical protein